jgi:calcineurin-like phosphoesterase family protein
MRYKNLDPTKIFFTSDTHFGHENIIKYCNRPFSDVHEMNKAITERWNEVIPEDGIVFHAGDFAYRSKTPLKGYREKLNGKIFLALGNHDRLKDVVKSGCFDDIQGYYDLIIRDDEMDNESQRITICHYPMYSWNQSHRGSWMLYGHHHGSMAEPSLLHVELSADCWDMYPISYYRVKDYITKRAMNKKH